MLEKIAGSTNFSEGRDPAKVEAIVAAMSAVSGVYVLVCAYRSVLPRVDLERLVVVDTHLSSIFLGRAAATVAEICFALQLGLLVHQLGVHANLPWVQTAAWAVPVFMVVAQGFCWHSVLTLNHITQAVESLLWIRSEAPAARLWACEQALRCADESLEEGT